MIIEKKGGASKSQNRGIETSLFYMTEGKAKKNKCCEQNGGQLQWFHFPTSRRLQSHYVLLHPPYESSGDLGEIDFVLPMRTHKLQYWLPTWEKQLFKLKTKRETAKFFPLPLCYNNPVFCSIWDILYPSVVTCALCYNLVSAVGKRKMTCHGANSAWG